MKTAELNSLTTIGLLWADPSLLLIASTAREWSFWTAIEDGPATQTRRVLLTTEHSASSYGQPVLVDRETGALLNWSPGDGKLSYDSADQRVNEPGAETLLRAAQTSWTAVTGG